MRIYTEYCKGRDKRIGEDTLRGMMAGVGGGILCWLGVTGTGPVTMF